MLFPEAMAELGMLGRREGSFSGQSVETNISRIGRYPSLSVFSFWSANREKGFFSGGERGELRILERKLAPGQLSRQKHLLPMGLGALTGRENSGK